MPVVNIFYRRDTFSTLRRERKFKQIIRIIGNFCVGNFRDRVMGPTSSSR